MDNEKKRKLFWILVAIVWILVAYVLTIYGNYFVSNKKTTPLVPTISVDKREAVLTKWVFEHSTKISHKTARNIVKEALKTNKPLLILAIFSAESEFNPGAVSNAGALGLGQIMWKYWGEDLKKAEIAKESRDLFDYDTNIQATSFILEKLLKGNNDIAIALTKYLGASNNYYKNKITETLTNLYILTQ